MASICPFTEEEASRTKDFSQRGVPQNMDAALSALS
jgi:hypothetical protein